MKLALLCIGIMLFAAIGCCPREQHYSAGSSVGSISGSSSNIRRYDMGDVICFQHRNSSAAFSCVLKDRR